MSTAFAAAAQGPLAAELLRRAITTFAAVPADERGAALAAIDGFLGAPSPATYLAAARVLAEARRDRTLRQVRTAQAGYAFARGLDAVRRELGPTIADTLAAGPTDDRAGLRLRALALLSAAHRELAERVAGRTDLLRKQLARAQDVREKNARPPRRPAPSRSRPSST